MLVLIDESGDTGFKEGASAFFIMTMVVFNDCDQYGRYPEAEKTAIAIQKVAEKSQHKPEFHFSQCSHKVRIAFFQELNAAKCNFGVYALVVDKKKIYSSTLKAHPKSFYNFLLKQLLTRNPVYGAKIKIDGSKSKEFKKALKVYLRKGKEGMFTKIKFVDSKTNTLVQLADMACGAVAYHHRNQKLGSDIYLKLLGKRMLNVWDFK